MKHFPACTLAVVSAIGMFSSTGVKGIEPVASNERYNRAKNLARINCGAKINLIAAKHSLAPVSVTADNNRSSTALLLDDNTLSCPLPQGDTAYVIELPGIALLDRFTFINQNAAAQGALEVSVSNYRLAPDDSRWIAVEKSARFAGKRLFNLAMVGVEAKYVKLSFHVTKEGRLAGLALYGQKTLESFAEEQDQPDRGAHRAYEVASTKMIARAEETLNFNFANIYARARVVYVSSGALPSARGMIDDDVLTGFRFAAWDGHPTMIVELEKSQRLYRVSTVYQAQARKLDVYLLNELVLVPSSLENVAPAASAAEGKTAVDFEPREARYVALRWTRDQSHGEPFEVAEVGAFSVIPLFFPNAEQVAPVLADTGSRRPGEGGVDFSNALGTLADPPVVAVVSP